MPNAALVDSSSSDLAAGGLVESVEFDWCLVIARLYAFLKVKLLHAF
jgi:hypothetical protein